MIVDPICATRVVLRTPTVCLIDPSRPIAEVFAPVVEAVPILFWNLAVVVDHRPVGALEAVEALRGLFAVDSDLRLHVDVIPIIGDVPCVLFEKREILSITHRVVVLPRRVPDVELDVEETVIWVLAVAVLVLDLESVVLSNLALVVLSGGFRAVAELREGELFSARHVPRQLLSLSPPDHEAPASASLDVVRKDPARKRPAQPFPGIGHDRSY